MANTRTIAVQVPEDLFQRIKDYLQRNNMTQRQFIIGLIEDELERDQTECESQNSEQEDDPELGVTAEQDENAAVDDSYADSGEDTEDEYEDEYESQSDAQEDDPELGGTDTKQDENAAVSDFNADSDEDTEEDEYEDEYEDEDEDQGFSMGM